MKMPVEQAERELSDIRQLMRHPGWALVCARFDKGLAQLKESVFDMKLDDETASRIRHSAAAVADMNPAALASAIEANRLSLVKKAADEAST